MHFLKALFIGASAFAAAVTAQGTGNLAFTSVPTSVTVGQSANITFSGASGVSILDEDVARTFADLIIAACQDRPPKGQPAAS